MTIGTLSPQRKLGSITADITIAEEHRDELEITSHPVEQGAAITDHAFKRPANLVLRLAWSDATPGHGDGFVRRTYAQLLDLQVSRELIDIETGKRSYSNMLISSLSLTTDETTETALFVTVECRQVIIVQTQTTTVPSPDLQKQPQATWQVAPTGTKQPTQVPGVTGQGLLSEVLGG